MQRFTLSPPLPVSINSDTPREYNRRLTQKIDYKIDIHYYLNSDSCRLPTGRGRRLHPLTMGARDDSTTIQSMTNAAFPQGGAGDIPAR